MRVIWFNAWDGAEKIGTMSITLIDVAPGPPPKYRCRVELDGKVVGEFDHDYDNGPWSLIMNATALVIFSPGESPDGLQRPETDTNLAESQASGSR